MGETTRASRDALLAPRSGAGSGFPEDSVELAGIGVVRVRGLSRLEAMRVQSANGPEAQERRILAYGMVDPVMTEEDAGRWQRISPAGEIETVTVRISQLSGLTPDAAKRAYHEFEDDPGSEFRVLPGGEAGPDGGPATSRDE